VWPDNSAYGDSDSRLGDYPTSDARWDIALDYVGGPRTGRGAALLEVIRERTYAFYQEGQYYTSAIFCRRAVFLAAEQLGPDHPSTLTTRHKIWPDSTRTWAGAEAETLFNEVLAKQEQTLGPEHPSTLTTRHNLAMVYQDMGRPEEAEALFNEVLAKQEQKLGPDHPNTLTTRAALEKLRAGRDGSSGGELPDARALTEAETPGLRPSMVARLSQVDAPLVG
jgi:tetratricopeptide (TPR) repeat protein